MTQGLRKNLEPGKKRHEFQTDHGFRKWFKTRCELAGMKPINIEKLMGHSTSDKIVKSQHIVMGIGRYRLQNFPFESLNLLVVFECFDRLNQRTGFLPFY